MAKEKTFIAETFLYLAAIILWYGCQWANFSGEYLDTDNYYRALRVMFFMEKPTYWEQIFAFSNYPFGEVLHWTRLLDWFWAALAIPFSFFYPLKDAIFYSGLFIAPLCFTAGAWYLVKCGRGLFNWKYRLLTAVLIIVQANVMRAVVLNRPDTHAGLFLLAAFILYKMLKFCKYCKIKDLIFASVACALALFLAVEGLFMALVILAFLYYAYLVLGYSYRSLLYFSFYYAVCLTLFGLMNPPYQGFLFVDSGRISIFYVVIFWSVYLSLYLGKFIKNNLLQGCFFLLCALSLLGIYVRFGWLSTPVAPEVMEPFIDRVSEMEAGNLYTLAYPFCALLCGLYLLKIHFYNAKFMFLLIALFVFTGLAATSMRFTLYAGIIAAFMLTLFVMQTSRKKMACCFFILLEYIAFIIQVLCGNVQSKQPINLPVKDFIGLPKGTFATDIFFAPYLIWYGGHSVIASPYHRNVEGIVDGHKIFFSENEDEVRALLDKHQVKYVLLLPNYDVEYYSMPEKNSNKLYGKILGSKQYPVWLKPLHEGNYYLFLYDKEK